MPVKGFDNFGGEDRLERFSIRFDSTEIPEDIAAVRDNRQFVSLRNRLELLQSLRNSAVTG